MKPLSVLIVDDEPIARDILETYIVKVPGLQLSHVCKNALEAFHVLSTNTIDLVFLDINMPEITGIDFLKTLKDPPHVIFVTAYSEYAADSYELDAVDYLLKPVSFDRFMKAVNKVMHLKQNRGAGVNDTITTPGNNIFVKSDGKLVKIDITKLQFVEGLKDYIMLWTETGKIIVHSTMKDFEDFLAPYPDFIRVHKSYIVNMNYVKEVDGNVIRIKDQMISIGSTYKDAFLNMVNKYKF
jgi:DNA-binding LytR/AlgR family response regulator